MLGGGEDARERSTEYLSDRAGVDGRLWQGLAADSVRDTRFTCAVDGKPIDFSVTAEAGTLSGGRVVLVVTRIVIDLLVEDLETSDAVVAGV